MTRERTTADFHICDHGECRHKATEWRRPHLYCPEHAAAHDGHLEPPYSICDHDGCPELGTLGRGPHMLCPEHAAEYCTVDGCNHTDCIAAAEEAAADERARDFAEDLAVERALDEWRRA